MPNMSNLGRRHIGHIVYWASKAGRGEGGGDASPAVKNLGGDVPQIREQTGPNPVFFRFLGYFGGRLATCRRFVPHSKIRGDAPGRRDIKISIFFGQGFP